MQPILSTLAEKPSRNEPHDLMARLYREIGISAVAAALEISGDALDKRPTAKEQHAALSKKAA